MFYTGNFCFKNKVLTFMVIQLYTDIYTLNIITYLSLDYLPYDFHSQYVYFDFFFRIPRLLFRVVPGADLQRGL